MVRFSIIAILFFGIWFLFSHINATGSQANPGQHASVQKKSYQPNYVRGIYLTAASAGRDAYRQDLIKKMANSRINTVVVDIKDYSGYILYDSHVPSVREYKAFKKVMDVQKVVEDFHAANVYIIARQTVFQDPMLANARPDLAIKTKSGSVWRDNKGLAWLDPRQRGVWEYNAAIAKEAVSLGFDEINFDYIRYPSDGNIANLAYNIPTGKTKAEAMQEFFQYISEQLTGLTPISIDMFGLVMDNANTKYDLGIGQRLTSALDYFDYICPMMYPSHYADGYLGFTNPADHPAEVIHYGIATSSPVWTNKRATLRPWLQAFSLGAVYDQTKIEAQIKETESASTTGWLLWNARNVYPDFIFKK